MYKKCPDRRGACVWAVRGARGGARGGTAHRRRPPPTHLVLSRIVLYRIVLCNRLRDRRRDSQIDSDAEEEEEKCGRRD